MLDSNDHTLKKDAHADSLIEELAQSTSESVKKLRGHTRRSLRVKVIVEPASMSARNGLKLQGVTGDISSGGSQILLAKPLSIGDLYQISFDREEFDIPPIFAICLRGRMVRPDAFEAGLRFLEKIEFPVEPATPEDSALII